MLKVVIAGGRDFDDFELMEEKLDSLLQNYDHRDIEIVCGCSRSIDKLGEKYALKNNMETSHFVSNKEFGKRSVYLKNEEIAKYSDCLVAFWDGKSKGTEMMVNLAKRNDLKIRIIEY